MNKESISKIWSKKKKIKINKKQNSGRWTNDKTENCDYVRKPTLLQFQIQI